MPTQPSPGDANGNGLPDILESIKQKYTDSKAITSPIILDLDGDGIETTAVGSGTWFDHDANGFAESTGWAGKDDGILVRDLDGNGTIDSGRELFGSETLLANGQKAANGFQALAELDSNLDGKIDASDAAYTTLNIWKDVDGDGTTDAGELLTLAEAGVQSLNVGYTASTAIDANGNQHQQIGSYTTTTGTTRAAEDVWFKVDKLNTLAEDWVAVSADIAALPDVTGYGNVYDLHQAMARDTTGQLKILVEQFAAATDIATRDALVVDILYKWTGSDTVAADSRGPYFDARRLAVLEQFMGEAYTAASCTLGVFGPNPHDMGAPILRQAWSQLVELVSSQLSAQTSLKPLYDQITYTWDETSQSLKGNLTQLIADLDARIAADPVAGQALLVEFARSIHGMGTEAQLDYAGLRTHYAADAALVKLMDYSETLAGTTGNDVIDGGNGHDVITGGAGNDTLSGDDGEDYLDGGAGADTLIGGAGDDVLGGDHWAADFYGVGNAYQGGTGNDELRGTVGADTYVFNLGDGKDTIHDYSNGVSSQDIIRFGAGITSSDITLRRSGTTLILQYSPQDQITVVGWYSSNNYYQIEQFQFADGTTWSLAALQALGPTIYDGTSANETVNGEAGVDLINGLGGNDVLDGGGSNDVLDGGDGNDVLHGNNGNDVLLGGLGADSLSGDAGDDLLEGGDGNDGLSDSSGNNTLRGGAGNDSITGTGTFEGGTGDDTLVAGASSASDTYLFNLGDGKDTIAENGNTSAAYADTVIFGAGITPAGVSLLRSGNDMILKLNDNDQITVKNWYVSNLYYLENIQFADGTTWNIATLQGMTPVAYDATAAVDTVNGWDGIDLINGLDGNDTLNGLQNKWGQRRFSKNFLIH